MLVLLLAIAVADGTAGHPCFADGTCHVGLECREGTCAARAADGTKGGVCYGNGTCNAGLECTAGMCTLAAATGDAGGECYGNGTCNAGLMCSGARCVATGPSAPAALPPPVPATQQRGAETAPARVVVLPLQAVDVRRSEAELLDGSVAGALQRAGGIEVVTQQDMQQLIDLEAQRQMLGCSQESCLAELADALGARYVVYGRVGRLGELWLVQLNLFDSQNAKAIGREELRAGVLEQLPARLGGATARLVAPLRGAAPPPPDPRLAEIGVRHATLREHQRRFALAPFGEGLFVCSSFVGTLGGVTAAYITSVSVQKGRDPINFEEFGNAVPSMAGAAAAGVLGGSVGGALWAFAGNDVAAEEDAFLRVLRDTDPAAATDFEEAATARKTGDALVPIGAGLAAGGAVATTLNAIMVPVFGEQWPGYYDVGVTQLAIGIAAVAVGGGLAGWGLLERRAADEQEAALSERLAVPAE